ncbi:MAG: hypothetical protein AMJ69_06860 [Gammaproteobacteria bacterium SG8_47]|nr:MAG: hypothetical protein AMJ69_06860 [Gammaproteobacteria bacterium SG8_47]
MERWFASDDPAPPELSTAHVNEGDLVFLTRAPQKAVHHHRSALTIMRASLTDGWVRMQQCHTNLDRVARAQIVFRQDRIRDLHIDTWDNIENAWVEGASVQLTNIQTDARLCLSAWTRALFNNEDGTYTLYNGPFMRKFLDGYYPMRVSMDVDFADTDLQLLYVSPQEQEGFQVSTVGSKVSFDAWFEGRLKTEFHFSKGPL